MYLNVSAKLLTQQRSNYLVTEGLRHNNNNNLFIYSALFNMLGDQKRIMETCGASELTIERDNHKTIVTSHIIKCLPSSIYLKDFF